MSFLRSWVVVPVALCFLAVAPEVCSGEPSAGSLFKRGRKLEKAGKVSEAYLLYSQAAAADPNNGRYWQRAQALQTKAAQMSNVMPGVSASFAASGLAQGASPEPAPESIPEATADDLAELRKPLPPVEIEGTPQRSDIDVRGDSKALWEQTLKNFGLEVIFEGDYEPGRTNRLRLDDVGYREALHALMSATSSFFVPISPNLIMVVKDTEPKRREVENAIAVSVPIPEPVSVQEAQEMARSVQQVMEIQKFAIDSAQRVVIMRDRASKVEPARMLLQQLLHGRAEIVLDVELFAMPRSTVLGLGLTIPTNFTIRAVPNIIRLFRGPLAFSTVITSAQLLATWTKSFGKSMFEAQLRATDGMPASFHAGEKYPIITSTYVGDFSSGEEIFRPPPTFNFEDLGLVLKITPKVHDTKEVTLEVEAEYKLLGSVNSNGLPTIANRQFKNHVRLRFDEAAVISGLVGKSSRTTLSSSIPGIGGIPILGTILGRRETRKEEDETMLVIRPRILHLPATETPSQAIWLGSEGRLRLPM